MLALPSSLYRDQHVVSMQLCQGSPLMMFRYGRIESAISYVLHLLEVLRKTREGAADQR